MKKSALAAGLKAAAEQRPEAEVVEAASAKAKSKTPAPTVLIGGHYPPEVRRVLLLVQAEPENTGKNLKQLLGEAINDLCAKYRKPQPYTGEP
jgi:antitoxin-like ribbon-helix-helix protein